MHAHAHAYLPPGSSGLPAYQYAYVHLYTHEDAHRDSLRARALCAHEYSYAMRGYQWPGMHVHSHIDRYRDGYGYRHTANEHPHCYEHPHSAPNAMRTPISRVRCPTE